MLQPPEITQFISGQPLRASTPPREAPMTTMSRGDPVRLTGRPSRLPGSLLTIRSLLVYADIPGCKPSFGLLALLERTGHEPSLMARLRRDQVSGHAPQRRRGSTTGR